MSSTTTPPILRPATRPGRLLLAVALGLLACLGVAPAAGAHGGPGNLELVSFDAGADQAAGGSEYEIAVKLTYAGDGDPVDDATVTVTGESDRGERLTPVALAAGGDGEFRGTVVLLSERSWNLTVVSVEPEAQLALEPVTVAAGTPAPGDTTTDGLPTDSPPAGGTSPEGTADPGTTEGRVSALEGASTTETTVPDFLVSSKPAPQASEASDEDDDSDRPWPVLVGAAVVLGLLLVFGVRYATTRRGPGEPRGPVEPEGPGDRNPSDEGTVDEGTGDEGTGDAGTGDDGTD